jgi:hypothetical protein
MFSVLVSGHFMLLIEGAISNMNREIRFQIQSASIAGSMMESGRSSISAFPQTAASRSTTAGSPRSLPWAFGLGRRFKRLNIHKSDVSLAQIAAGFSALVSLSHRTGPDLSTNA